MPGNPRKTASLDLPPLARDIASAVDAAGGRAWVVGGTVRDALLGRPSKDVDLEVHGIEAARLHKVLAKVGPVAKVGRSFGVFKVGPGADPIDVALPRPSAPVDTQTRGEVQGDPHMGLEAACRGRDLTINAIAADALSGELVDPTGGIDDLAHRRLRAAEASRFGDDPLRVVRVARFAGNLGFLPTEELVGICRALSLEQVAMERVAGELEKLLLKSERPSIGLKVLHDTYAWPTVLSEVDWHPGLGPQVDRAAGLTQRVGPPPRSLALLLGALLGGTPASVAASQLTALRIHRRDGFDVQASVVAALQHLPALQPEATDTVLRTMAEQVECAVAIAIAEAVSATELDGLHRRATELGVLHSALVPLLFGRDLVALGVRRGPAMGRILKEVRAAQLRGDVATPETATRLAETLWTSEQAQRV